MNYFVCKHKVKLTWLINLPRISGKEYPRTFTYLSASKSKYPYTRFKPIPVCDLLQVFRFMEFQYWYLDFLITLFLNVTS